MGFCISISILCIVFSICFAIAGFTISFCKVGKAIKTGDWDQAELSLYMICSFLSAFAFLVILIGKL